MSVYFMTCRFANAVKIGFSYDPHGRLPEIQLGCPMPISLEAVLPGTMEDERAFHARFAGDRLKGEWFTITPMIEAIIAANIAPIKEPKPRRRCLIDSADTLAARIRQRLNISRAEMAAKLGISEIKLRRYERGWGRHSELPAKLEARLNEIAKAHLVKEIEAAL